MRAAAVENPNRKYKYDSTWTFKQFFFFFFNFMMPAVLFRHATLTSRSSPILPIAAPSEIIFIFLVVAGHRLHLSGGRLLLMNNRVRCACLCTRLHATVKSDYLLLNAGTCRAEWTVDRRVCKSQSASFLERVCTIEKWHNKSLSGE